MRYFIGDVRDKERLNRALEQIEIVVHATALKQVPAAEYNPFECIKTNILGGRNLKFAVVRYGNVMGSRGSVIPFFLDRRSTGVLPRTDPDMTRFNITLQKGVDMVIWTIDHARGGELLVPKIPSFRIVDLAEAISPACQKPVIGIRAGEKIHEEMITSSDSFHTVDMGLYPADIQKSEPSSQTAGSHCPAFRKQRPF